MENKPIRINLSSFDLIKGASIVLVILAHMCAFHYDPEQVKILTPLYFIVFMSHSVLMPLFFVISGFGLKERTPKKMLKMTFRSMIVPYLWVAVIFVPTFAVATYLGYGSLSWGIELSNRYLLAFLLGIPKEGHIIGGVEVRHITAVWFFLALFISFNLLNLIIKIKKATHRVILVILCILTGYFLALHDINFFCIPQGLLAVGCCYVGYLLKKYELLDKLATNIWPYLILIPIFLIEGFWGNMDLAAGHFKLGLLDYILSTCASVLILLVGLKLDRFDSKVLDGIRFIGIYSYWIMCIHAVEETCMQWWLFVEIMPNQLMAFFVELLLKIIIITSGCVILKKISKAKHRRRITQYVQ